MNLRIAYVSKITFSQVIFRKLRLRVEHAFKVSFCLNYTLQITSYQLSLPILIRLQIFFNYKSPIINLHLNALPSSGSAILCTVARRS